MRLFSLVLLIPFLLLNTTTTFAESKCELMESQLSQFMVGLKVDTPKQAVDLWILGVKNRSGAVQFAMLSPSLQQKTRKKFEQNNWGTGQSSPWVDNFHFSKKEVLNNNKVQFTIEYDILTSYANLGRWKKVITVEKNEDPYTNWFISDIRTNYNQWEAFTPAETVSKE